MISKVKELKNKVPVLRNRKNFIPEIYSIIGCYGFSYGAAEVLENSENLPYLVTAASVPICKAVGAYLGKVGGYCYYNRDLLEDKIDEYKKDVKNISKIYASYYSINLPGNALLLYSLQKAEIMDNSNPILTVGTVMAFDAICASAKMFVENKKGIYK